VCAITKPFQRKRDSDPEYICRKSNQKGNELIINTRSHGQYNPGTRYQKKKAFVRNARRSWSAGRQLGYQ